MHRKYFKTSFLLTTLVCCCCGSRFLAHFDFSALRLPDLALIPLSLFVLAWLSGYLLKKRAPTQRDALRDCLFGITCAIGFCYSLVLIFNWFLWACIGMRM